MGRYSGGYTIIEVMIVIAITGVLFLSSVLVFQQQQGRTGFSQAVQDLSSKIQNFASEVSAGTYDGSQGYFCAADASGNVSLTRINVDNSGCVFLGRVIQVNIGQGSLNTYAVIGTRDTYSGGRDTGQLANTVDQSNPTLATYTAGGNTTMVSEEDFQLPVGDIFVSSKDSNDTPETDLVGLYNNLQSSGGAAGSASNNLLLKFYNCNTGPTGNGCTTVARINNCVATNTVNLCGTNAPIASHWLLCVKDNSNRMAQLRVTNTTGGLSIKLAYDFCS